jgi:hypothetical protein
LAGFGVRLLGGGLGGLVHAAGVLGLAGLEAVLESAGDVLQVPRAASADGLSPLGLLTPVDCEEIELAGCFFQSQCQTTTSIWRLFKIAIESRVAEDDSVSWMAWEGSNGHVHLRVLAEG